MSGMKNMVILKDVQSNLVEEAIIVFKENVKIKKEQTINKGSKVNMQKSFKDDLCVKEAENIIMDYINRTQNSNVEKILMKKIKYLKFINIFLVISLVIISFCAFL